MQSNTKSPDELLLKDFLPDLMLFLLKMLTNGPKNALSASQMKLYLKTLTGHSYVERTISRNLTRLVENDNNLDSLKAAFNNNTMNVLDKLSAYPKDYKILLDDLELQMDDEEPDIEVDYENISDAHFAHIGGRVCSIEVKVKVEKKKKNKKEQSEQTKIEHRYYFEHLTGKDELELLCGTVQSNLYLSEQEKSHLLDHIKLLNLYTTSSDSQSLDNIEVPMIDQEEPEPNEEAHVPNRSTILLRNISTIYDAIQNKKQISATYGNYDVNHQNPNSMKLDFHKREHPYILNPYALVWNRGFLYLVATRSGKDIPIHFRVDRFITINKIPDSTTTESVSHVNRDRVPDVLRPYYDDHLEQFDSIKYTKNFPLMMGMFKEHKRFITAYIECSQNTLSLLIDTFGTNVRVLPSTLPHKGAKDYNGNPAEFVIAEICDVQYDNILLFCLQQQATVTNDFSPIFALAPQTLVQDIQEHLEASANRYKAYQSISNKYNNPFSPKHTFR